MRKVYICPEIEVTQAKLNEELLAGHSYDWVDAKGQSEELFDEEDETIRSRNLWDE